MFINTGLLIETEDPGEVIGVIAHETGHIAGGHIARSGAAMEQTYATLIATYLLGLGAAPATGGAGDCAAVLSGGPETGRATGRERMGQYGSIQCVAVGVKKNKKK